MSQGDSFNCDLTDQDSSNLDKYSLNYDFYESSVSDFYERDPQCRKISSGQDIVTDLTKINS